MTLIRLRSGIYSVDGCQPRPCNNLVLAVHPYYQFDPDSLVFMSKPRFSEGKTGDPEYIAKFENLVKSASELVTFEEASRVPSTAERYRRIGVHRGYFIKTKEDSPQPVENEGGRLVEVPWDDVFDFLRVFEVPLREPIRLVGGYYNIYFVGTNVGCLNALECKIRMESLPAEVLKEITF